MKEIFLHVRKIPAAVVVADIPRHCRFAADLPDGARGHLWQVRTLRTNGHTYDMVRGIRKMHTVRSGKGYAVLESCVTNFHAVMGVGGVDVIACLRPSFTNKRQLHNTILRFCYCVFYGYIICTQSTRFVPRDCRPRSRTHPPQARPRGTAMDYGDKSVRKNGTRKEQQLIGITISGHRCMCIHR